MKTQNSLSNKSHHLYKLSAILCFLLLSGLIYIQTLNYSFHFDDYEFIVTNSHVHDLGNIKNIWKANSFPVRFVTFWTFALNYHFSSLDVWGYHVFNILIHTINGFLVWWLVWLLFGTPYVSKQLISQSKLFLAPLVGFLFLVHPLQTQAVTYICQRFASLATMFYLLSFCFYLQSRIRPLFKNVILNYSLAGIFALIGMFTKQILFTLPVMLVVCEILFFERKRLNKKWLFIIGAFLCVIPTLYKFNFQRFFDVSVASRSHMGDTITWWGYFITQPRVVMNYLRLLILPLKQHLDYDFMVSHSVLEGAVLSGLAIIFALFVVARVFYNRQRLITFGILWFFITISIESSIFPLQQVIFEHRCYLPMVGFGLVILGLAYEIISKPSKRYIFISVIVLCFTFMAFQRNKVWQNEVTLWKDVTLKSPDKARAYVHLGVGYLNNGQYSEALEALTRALEIDPKDYRAYNNRGIVHQYTNNFKLALGDYSKAIELMPSYAEIYHNKGNVFYITQEFEKALEFYDKTLDIAPEHIGALFNRANVYLLMGDQAAAVKDLNRLLLIDKNHLGALQVRADLNYSLGLFNQALLDYENVLRLSPNDNLSYANRSLIFNQKADYRQAYDEAKKAKNLGAQVDERYFRYLEQKLKKEIK